VTPRVGTEFGGSAVEGRPASAEWILHGSDHAFAHLWPVVLSGIHTRCYDEI
jgi:hypothetical protein